MSIYDEIFTYMVDFGLASSQFGQFFSDIFSVFLGTCLLFGVPFISFAFVLRLIRRW